MNTRTNHLRVGVPSRFWSTPLNEPKVNEAPSVLFCHLCRVHRDL